MGQTLGPRSSGRQASAPRQRQHLRFRIEGLVAHLGVKGTLTSIGQGHVTQAHAAINLSEGGVLLAAKNEFTPGTRVVIRIERLSGHDAFETAAEVRWCRPEPKAADQFQIGLKFEDLGAAARETIARLRRGLASLDEGLGPEFRRESVG